VEIAAGFHKTRLFAASEGQGESASRRARGQPNVAKARIPKVQGGNGDVYSSAANPNNAADAVVSAFAQSEPRGETPGFKDLTLNGFFCKV
jgi:hypothetical protein